MTDTLSFWEKPIGIIIRWIILIPIGLLILYFAEIIMLKTYYIIAKKANYLILFIGGFGGFSIAILMGVYILGMKISSGFPHRIIGITILIMLSVIMTIGAFINDLPFLKESHPIPSWLFILLQILFLTSLITGLLSKNISNS